MRFLILIYLLFFSSISLGIDVIIEDSNQESKIAIYNKLLTSLKEGFDEINIIKEKNIIHINSKNKIIYVIGHSLFDKINKIDKLKSNFFILLGSYKIPKNLNKQENWKMISLFADANDFYNLITSKLIKTGTIYILKNNENWFVDFFMSFNNVKIIKIDSYKNAIKEYRKIFSKAQKNDIILIAPKNFFNKIVFSEILKLSWKYKVKTASILSSHTKKGILLSPYVQYDNLSDFFNNYVIDFYNHKKIEGVPVSKLLGNKRVAKHLNFSHKEIKTTFEAVY